MRLLHYRGLIIAILLILLAGAGYVGWLIRSHVIANDQTAMQTKLTDCEADQQKAIHDAQDAAGWVALADKQIGDIIKERDQLKHDYEDSLRIVRALLPDAAEREIANYYRSRQQHPR